jgi:opacity protein-like surface antigen
VEVADVTGYKYTVGPSYAFNEHFTLRGEVSYTDTDLADTNILFTGVQALVKF